MAKTTYSREELELSLAEMAAQLANAESKLESAEKLIDTLRQDKDKVIDMSIERVNKLLSRAEAAEKRIAELESLTAPKLTQPALVSVPEVVGCEDVPEEVTEDDIALAYAWAHGFNQCRAAILQCSEPVQEWIPCSERMPDKLIPVMVMYEDGGMWSAMWNGNRWDDGTEYPDLHSVTHWREMPAAPQQEVNRG